MGSTLADGESGAAAGSPEPAATLSSSLSTNDMDREAMDWTNQNLVEQQEKQDPMSNHTNASQETSIQEKSTTPIAVESNAARVTDSAEASPSPAGGDSSTQEESAEQTPAPVQGEHPPTTGAPSTTVIGDDRAASASLVANVDIDTQEVNAEQTLSAAQNGNVSTAKDPMPIEGSNGPSSENQPALGNTTISGRKRNAREPNFDDIDDLSPLVGRHAIYRGDPAPADEDTEFDDDAIKKPGGRGRKKRKTDSTTFDDAVDVNTSSRRATKGRKSEVDTAPATTSIRRGGRGKTSQQNRPQAKSSKRRTVPRATSAYSEYLMKKVPDNDPHPHYVEEDSWKYHNPPLGGAVGQDDLKALPKPFDMPAEFPRSSISTANGGEATKWTTNEETRELHAEFVGENVDPVDEKFLTSMMERNDLTIVCSGLLNKGLDYSIWSVTELTNPVRDEFYHKFHQYNLGKQPDGAPEKCLSMKMSQFMEYIRLLDKRRSQGQKFEFDDDLGQHHTVNLSTDVLFVKGLDMARFLPDIFHDFVSAFGLKGLMPGGVNCMMNKINANGRPYMGPHLNITPPGPMTSLHQSGQGTLDSGIVCINGFIEIVMLRRLPERHKQNALAVLYGQDKSTIPNLYASETPPKWPTVQVVEKWRKMGYCPSTLILRPGQYIHIGKGRLHATRQLSSDALPRDDCHFHLREQLVEEVTYVDSIGITVSWEWMFRGSSTEGINREVLASLECAELNRRNVQKSLAQPELCLVQMARTLLERDDEKLKHMTGYNRKDAHPLISSNVDELRGILPGLRYIVRKQLETMKQTGLTIPDRMKGSGGEGVNDETTDDKSDVEDYDKSLRRLQKPNAFENPLKFPVDPYGVSGFFCQICHKELSNVYLHCEGCENLLSKDFNICLRCYQEERDRTFVRKHERDSRILSTAHHTGQFPREGRAGKSSCKPKEYTVCKHCRGCPCCKCTCHSHFSVRLRFFNEENEETILNRVEQLVGNHSEVHGEAFERLHQAATGTSYEECIRSNDKDENSNT